MQQIAKIQKCKIAKLQNFATNQKCRSAKLQQIKSATPCNTSITNWSLKLRNTNVKL